MRQFAQSFWANVCIVTLLDEVSSLEWDIVPDKDHDFEELEFEMKRIKKFLEHPNQNRESFTEVLRSWLKDLYELDAGVIVKVYSFDSYDFDDIDPLSGAPRLKPRGQRTLKELYARDGSSFLIETDMFGFERGYWQYSYQIPAHPIWFWKEEISYIMRNRRSMSPYGYAPMQAILDIIKSLHYSTLYNKRFFEESPIPDGALALLDTNKQEMKDFTEWWNREFLAQPHKLALINKDIKWQPFNISQRELEFLETQEWYFKMVISMFGLTPAELGLTDDLNRATSATQAELTKRKGIRPLLKMIENFINEDIMPEFEVDGLEFRFIYDDPSEQSQKLSNWQTELSMGVKSINEVREEMGLEPVEWGDKPQIESDPFSGLMGNQGQPNMEETSHEEEEQEKIIKPHDNTENERRNEAEAEATSSVRSLVGTKSLKKQITDKVESAARDSGFSPEQIKRGLKVEDKHFTAVGGSEDILIQLVLNNLREDPNYYAITKRAFSKPDIGPYKSYEECIGMNQDKENPESYCADIQRKIEQEDESGVVKKKSKTTKGNLDIDMSMKEYTGYDYQKFSHEINNFAISEEYRKKIKSMLSDLSKDKIDKIISTLAEGIKRGDTIRMIAEKINRFLDDRKRAELIARTETIRIVNESNIIRLKNQDVKVVEWVSAPEDGRLCKVCKKLDGQRFKINEVDPPPSPHPNCRCTLGPVAGAR